MMLIIMPVRVCGPITVKCRTGASNSPLPGVTKRDEVNYSIGANITSLQNKVLKLGTSEGYREGDYGQVNRTQEGRSVSDFYLIKMNGIFQNWDEVFAYTTTLEDGTTVH